MEDLYNALLQQEEKEAHHVATALEIYVKGSLNLFNHRTNVNVENRLVCYDIKELGKQMKKIGMLVIQDQVLGPRDRQPKSEKIHPVFMARCTFLKRRADRRLLGGNLEAVPEVEIH